MNIWLKVIYIMSIGFFIHGCGNPFISEKAIHQDMLGNMPESRYIKYEGNDFHYTVSGNPQNPLIVFIHGSPGGGWEGWGTYLSDPAFKERFYIITVDRWGFGESMPGHAQTSLAKHAGPIAKIIQKESINGKAITIGHSYGGPVQFKLAADYPALTSHIISLAPALDPISEKPRWFNYAADFGLINWMLPKAWRASNDEIMPLYKELEQMKSQLKDITAPVTVIHGVKDSLVSVSNTTYIKDNLPQVKVEIVLLKDQDHFIPWQASEQIKQEILDVYQAIEN